MKLLLQFLFAVAGILSALPLSAQAPLLPIRVNHEWGMISPEGELKIPPKFDYIGKFRNGFARVSSNKKVGIISEDGRLVLPPEFDRIRHINDTLVLVPETGTDAEQQTKWGLVHLPSGRQTPRIFHHIEGFKKSYARITQFQAPSAEGKEAQLFGYVSPNAELVIPPEYPGVYHMKDTIFYVKTPAGWGVMDQHQKVLVPYTFDKIRHLENGKFAVQKEEKWGVLEAEGTLLLPVEHEDVKALDEKLYTFREGEFQGVKSAENEVILPPEFPRIFKLGKGWICMSRTNAHFGFARGNTGEILPNNYKEVQMLNESYLAFRIDSLWGIASAAAEETFPPRFDEVKMGKEGHFHVVENGKHGIIKADGNWSLSPEYDWVEGFNGAPISKVKQNDSWGIINEQGQILVPTEFERIELYGTVARAFGRGSETPELFYFDEAGNPSNNIQFIVRGNGSNFSGGSTSNNSFLPGNMNGRATPSLLTARREGWFFHPTLKKWGLKDPDSGRLRIRPTFDKIIAFREVEGLIVLVQKVNRERRISLATMNGKMLTAAIFKDIELEDFANSNVARAKIGSKVTLINRKGKPAPIRDLSWVGQDQEGFFRFNVGGRMRLSEHRTSETLETHYRKDRVTGDRVEVYLHCEGGKWGVLNAYGKVVVKPHHHYLSDMEAGVMLFKNLSGKWGALDRNFEPVIHAKYDGIKLIRAGDSLFFALNLDGGSYGFIDSLGRNAIPPRYENVGTFSEGLAPAAMDGKWGFINTAGAWVILPQYRNARSFFEGKAWVLSEKYWKVIGHDGGTWLEGSFRKVGDFQQGLAPVAEKYLFGYLDAEGEYLLKPSFTYAESFENGYARVREGRKWGILSANGKFIAPPKYYRMEQVGEHLFAGRVKRSIHLINAKTGEISRTKAIEIGEFAEGLAPFRAGQYWGYMDSTGKTVIKPQFTWAKPFQEELAAVRIRGNWGFINKQAEIMIPPAYRNVQSFSEGLAAVETTESWHYIDPKGRLPFEKRFSEAGAFVRGLAPVKTQGKWTYINDQGEMMQPPLFSEALPLKGAIGLFAKDELYGILNPAGSISSSPKFEEVGTFSEGFAPVKVRRQSGLISLQGKEILPPLYDQVTAFNDLIQIEKDGNTGYLHANGSWIWRVETPAP